MAPPLSRLALSRPFKKDVAENTRALQNFNRNVLAVSATHPRRAAADKKSFPRAAPMQQLAPRWNSERPKGLLTALD